MFIRFDGQMFECKISAFIPALACSGIGVLGGRRERGERVRYAISCTQVVYHEYRYVVVLWCSLFTSQLISIIIMCVVDVVSADSKSQSATTPTETPPSTDPTSQKSGE